MTPSISLVCVLQEQSGERERTIHFHCKHNRLRTKDGGREGVSGNFNNKKSILS